MILYSKGVYDAACLVLSRQDPEDPTHKPSERLGINQFAVAVERRAKQIRELREQLAIRETAGDDRLF